MERDDPPKRQTAFLKPTPGGLVRHPESRRPLAEDGEEVELTRYWRRRLRAGDVEQVEADEQPARRARGRKTTPSEG